MRSTAGLARRLEALEAARHRPESARDIRACVNTPPHLRAGFGPTARRLAQFVDEGRHHAAGSPDAVLGGPGWDDDDDAPQRPRRRFGPVALGLAAFVDAVRDAEDGSPDAVISIPSGDDEWSREA